MIENKRILIVDDDDGIRNTYFSIFRFDHRTDILSEGKDLFKDDEGAGRDGPHMSYEVVPAENGMIGLEKVKEALENNTPFAVAFIDMKMPGLNGAQTAREIWELDPDVKIVIVTAYSEHSPQEMIETTGRDDLFYLRKPFNREEILQFARALTNEWNLEKKRRLLEAELKKVNESLEEKVKKQAAMIVQTEKMATVGLLAAGVAHEINNPISYVNANLSMLKKYCEPMMGLYDTFLQMESLLGAADIPAAEPILRRAADLKSRGGLEMIFGDIEELVCESLEGVDRVKVIVQDLKTFSRADTTESSWADINACIETALKMIHNEVKYNISIDKELGDLPDIRCHSQKLTQVIMNLLINAAQAISDRGTVSISTRVIAGDGPGSEQRVKISIADTGIGIPLENIHKLFDPFFTTKPVGMGTGLGLSIVYEIITAHGGTIEVDSRPGEGTRFDILLPVDAEGMERKREE